MSGWVSAIEVTHSLVKQLVEGSAKSGRAVFVDHVQPLHDLVLGIHNDYITGFRTVLKLLESDSSMPSDIVDFLSLFRADGKLRRMQAFAVAKSLARGPVKGVGGRIWKVVSPYIDSVEGYFESANCHSLGTPFEGFIAELLESRVLEPAERMDVLREAGDEISQAVSETLPSAIHCVITSYATVRKSLLR